MMMMMMMRRLSFVWLLLTRCSFRSITTTTLRLLIQVAGFAIGSSGGRDDGRSSSAGATAQAVATTSTTLSTGDADFQTKYFTNN